VATATGEGEARHGGQGVQPPAKERPPGRGRDAKATRSEARGFWLFPRLRGTLIKAFAPGALSLNAPRATAKKHTRAKPDFLTYPQARNVCTCVFYYLTPLILRRLKSLDFKRIFLSK
jgi:hypothetical protein